MPEQPTTLTLTAPCEIAAAASSGDGAVKPRRFSMTAYTGGPMTLAGWRYPVVVDLAGLTVGDRSRPIFLGHQQDVDDVVGQTDRIEIAEGQLVASGDVLGDSPRVQRVIALADKGFRWQASIGAQAQKVDFVKPSQSVVVNGRSFDGPINVARRSVLGEISFVPLGADTNTTALIANHRGDQPTPPPDKDPDMEFTQWLSDKGFDPDQLSDDQTATLRAAYASASTATDPAAAATEGPATPAGGPRRWAACLGRRGTASPVAHPRDLRQRPPDPRREGDRRGLGRHADRVGGAACLAAAGTGGRFRVQRRPLPGAGVGAAGV